MGPFDALVISCEHGGNRVPRRYARHFARARRALGSHRGWDPGALPVARALARRLRCPLHAATTTRLLVELNRSRHHRDLFSEFTPRDEADAILARHYHPYRDRLAEAIAAAPSPVLHLSVHSFTPVLRGVARTADIGLLYDPARRRERAACAWWRDDLKMRLPGMRIRRNYPYRGAADGLTTALRRRFPDRCYAGIELELNQALFAGGRTPPAVVAALAAGLKSLRPRGRG